MELKWRIYYADGTTFSHTDGKPEDAPAVGVICIKQCPVSHGWILTALQDYYLYIDDEWWGVDSAGFWQYLFKPGLKLVKFGTTMNDEGFEKIMAEARHDPFGDQL